jgi:uncharacterized protein YhfF
MGSGRLELLELGTPGPMRDALVAAVLEGEKTATTSLLMQYEDSGEVLPDVGAMCVMVGSDQEPVAVVEIVDVEVIRLRDADVQLALDEGEGFRSVAEWRAAHERFWTDVVLPDLRNQGATRVDDETRVVVERFRVSSRA